MMLTATTEGRSLDYHALSAPEAVGLGVYTQQPENDTARATSVVTTFSVPRDLVEELISDHPRLAVELGRVTDNRRELLATAQEKARQAIGG
ncbi:hypothetical protein KAE78_04925 [Microbacterium sp. NIBRBAC000506063]|nr:hypothetical protein [Microbacterium sp. NIBRBAC000506063]QTV80317.1 hypothetical protein KAE78_04925 [Microbacterium sp. NIBRBAC000506063]